MAQLNDHYLKLKAGYLFPEISRRVKTFCEANPEAAKRLIRCGIGDVTEPLPPAVVAALHQAVEEMGQRNTFRGYGPEQGYEFLRTAIAKNDFRDRGLEVADDEIFVSDGSKCDCGNILDGTRGTKQNCHQRSRLSRLCRYECDGRSHRRGGQHGRLRWPGLSPVHAGERLYPGAAEGKGGCDLPLLPEQPDGRRRHAPSTCGLGELRVAEPVDPPFDAAYESYISDPALPHSIYEIPGARECAIEFRSFSKNGGFTGTRCAFTVVPKSLLAATHRGEFLPLHPLWQRRTSTKFNGVSYIVQRGAEALYSSEGKAQTNALIDHYMGNARVLVAGATKAGLTVHGGLNAPYIWVQTPNGVTSWQAFDKILHDANVVITPGAGFGSKGEGYFRISAFNSRANAEEVARRLLSLKW